MGQIPNSFFVFMNISIFFHTIICVYKIFIHADGLFFIPFLDRQMRNGLDPFGQLLVDQMISPLQVGSTSRQWYYSSLSA
jgi:hypothetical protein